MDALRLREITQGMAHSAMHPGEVDERILLSDALSDCVELVAAVESYEGRLRRAVSDLKQAKDDLSRSQSQLDDLRFQLIRARITPAW